ncbi:CBS domain-containing protein [Allobaculum mucilyticum]|uniref:CBS domain-containing protein n=1 Tax=Allobaculum mucilyticum TaxID=2834459 RepID=UPI001E5C4224|nr:CBS domain-containing protein [Allobaculum mucilyticum]UNT95124.1 CBS domain-containing protein [Allobaculum mucilyticum]
MNQNIIFFLTYKKDLQFLYDSLPLDEALVLMNSHGYTAVPVIDASGVYKGTVSEGDFLWYILKNSISTDELGSYTVSDLLRPDFMPAVNINVSMDELFETSLHQNFVPVVDDRNIFIGIVTRQAILRHFRDAQNAFLPAARPYHQPAKSTQLPAGAE